MKNHGERKHSKFSASGAERWLACPGSVALSEGIPSKDSVWSLEGTRAHEVLERLLRLELSGNDGAELMEMNDFLRDIPREMFAHAAKSANWLLKKWEKTPGSQFQIETRIHLPFIHQEMFGTFDGAIIDYFGTLHVYDFKYGAGVAVSPRENLQMIFYALGLAYLHDWNFKRVRLWIDQPRIRGYDGPMFWEIGIMELREYVRVFKRGVKRALENPTEYVEGSHCHWCNAKNICPLKTTVRRNKILAVFTGAGL